MSDEHTELKTTVTIGKEEAFQVSADDGVILISQGGNIVSLTTQGWAILKDTVSFHLGDI